MLPIVPPPFAYLAYWFYYFKRLARWLYR